MKTINKKYIAMIICLIVLLVALIGTACLYYVRHVEESDLYKTISPYRDGEQEWQTPKDLSFGAESGEGLFLQGMDAFAAEEYETAKATFEEALAEGGTDPALPAWLYYYINECTYNLTGAGDFNTVSDGLDAAAAYAPMANDRDMLWDMVYTVTGTPEKDAKAVELIEKYLMKAPDLELATWARLKNCIAMLEYMAGEYAAAIRTFYDVELELEDRDLTPEEREELCFAKEYIANVYYIFEDFERAAELYGELADSTDPEENTGAGSYYVNMSTAYLELGDTESAREAVQKLQERIPHMEDAVKQEMQAVTNDVLADICIAEGNYTDAEMYLEEAEAFYREDSAGVFYGGVHFVTLSRCELMMREGDQASAQASLEELLTSGEAAYYGLELDVYELLMEIYRQTGQDEKLAEAYAFMLDYDENFTETIQREYLDFSEYYRDVIRLEHHNTKLSRMNTISILIIAVFAVILVAAFFLTRLLRTKNVTDQLTGVYNRKKLNQLMQRYKRAGTPGLFGVVMMDIDYFKRYNDTCGHPAGDAVLKQVAAVLSESVRKDDMVIRYGGEEFLVLLNGLQGQTAYEVCQRIRRRLAERAIPHGASEAADHVTLSMGLCYQESAGTKSMDELIKYADECLYASKGSGRNRVTEKRL